MMATQNELSAAPLQPVEPAAGFEVFTVDGRRVGTVSEIRDGFMRIDARRRPDFWLRLDDATNVEGRAITLAYPREALEQHKHAEPVKAPEEFEPAGADPVLLDEEERQAQREMMEHELAEQRRRREAREAHEAPAPGPAPAGGPAPWEPVDERDAGRIVGVVIIAAAAAVAAVVVLVALRRRRRDVRGTQ